VDDVAWIWLLFFTGSGSTPIIADPVARRTFLVPRLSNAQVPGSIGILVPARRGISVPAHGDLIIVPAHPFGIEV
jgi:hypothetical protein